MPELWGSVAVDDHVGPRALVAAVLLFDRIIFPVPPMVTPKRLTGGSAKSGTRIGNATSLKFSVTDQRRTTSRSRRLGRPSSASGSS